MKIKIYSITRRVLMIIALSCVAMSFVMAVATPMDKDLSLWVVILFLAGFVFSIGRYIFKKIFGNTIEK